jgi:hypothetical protein
MYIYICMYVERPLRRYIKIKEQRLKMLGEKSNEGVARVRAKQTKADK